MVAPTNVNPRARRVAEITSDSAVPAERWRGRGSAVTGAAAPENLSPHPHVRVRGVHGDRPGPWKRGDRAIWRPVRVDGRLYLGQ